MNRSNWPTLSVLLNIVLFITVVALAKYAMNPPSKSVAANVTATTVATTSNVSHPLVFHVASTNANEPDWRQWLAQLRAAGVPDKVLAGLVSSDFELRWEKQRREMQKRYDKGDLDDDAMTLFVEQHDADAEQEMKEALGPAGFRQWDTDKVLADFDMEKMKLSGSESDAFYQMRKDLAQKERDLSMAHARGDIDDADFNDGDSAAQKDYDQKLKTMLGDDRYAAMQNPDDSQNGALVRSLKSLNASDSQFEALMAAQKEWNAKRTQLDQQNQGTDEQGKSYDDQMKAIDAARDAAYEHALGTNGFDALQKSQNPEYQTLQRYASTWQLSADDIDYIYRATQYMQKSVADYRQRAHTMEEQGQQVDWPKVEQNILEFTQQTQQGLLSYLGEERFNKLKKNSIFEANGD